LPRLHTRIYLHSLGVLLAVGVITAVTLAVGARGAGLREIAERVGRHTVALVAEAYGDPPALALRVRQLHADLELDVTVRDLDGRVVAAGGAPRPALDAADAARVRAGEAVVRSGPRWSAAAPVREPASGAVVGIVQIGAPRRTGWPAGLLWAFLTVGAILLAVALVTRPLARRISRPLERLAGAVNRFGGGDLATRAPDPPEGRRRFLRHRVGDEITELTRAFNSMADRIERLVRGQKELLANVSHELRSPLARVRVALPLVPRTGDAESRLSDIEADLDELDRLIDDVLTGARLEATGLGREVRPVDARGLLAELADRARRDPATAGREIETLVEGTPTVVGDAGLLRRALWNLVTNAARYGAPPIRLTAADADGWVRLSVSDEGPGIAAPDRQRVLDPFARVDRARTPGTGTAGVGLGLTLARQVALAHGGAIEITAARVDDGRERGCRVTLRLPARGADAH
jgi:signal transduction histidine kinase